MSFLQICTSSLWSAFSFSWHYLLHRAETFNVQFISYFFHELYLDVVSEKSSPLILKIIYIFPYLGIFQFCVSVRLMNQFGLIFLMAVGSVSIFCFWYVNVQLFQYHVSKDYTLFSLYHPCSPCQTSVDYLYMGLFLGSILCVLIYFSILLPVSHCLDYYNRHF